MGRLQRGDEVGIRFTIEGRLASGGMAEVYVATMKLAGGAIRRVALKRIHPHLAEDPEFVEMFVDEARLASQLAHPGVISVLDAVEEGGTLLLVLEYVPGWDLSALLRAAQTLSKLPEIGVAIAITRSIADTLSYVHSARSHEGDPLNVIHRDITPANILLARDGTTRLLDFGVAKAASRSARTRTRTLKGKVSYMAPEQVRGLELDQRSDLYAVGLVGFELLTGRRFNPGQDEIESLERARDPQFVAPSQFRPVVPPALDRILERALAPDPDDRFSTADEMKKELDRVFGTLDNTSPNDVQEWVLATMGSHARPLEGDRSDFEKALRRATNLGPGDDEPATHARSLLDRSARVVEVFEPQTEVEDTPTRSVEANAPDGPPTMPVEDLPRPTPSFPDIPARIPATRPRVRAWPFVAVLGLALAIVVGVQLANQEPERTVEAPPSGGDRVAPSEHGFIRLTSTPTGARVEIDGAAWPEATPTVFESPAGDSRTIVLSLDDYLADRFEATARSRETLSLARTLIRKPGRLSITTTPPGATIAIDGEERGTTPLALDSLSRELVRVELRLEGYLPTSVEVDLTTESEAEITQTLIADIQRGELWINADIQRVELRIDGRLVSHAVPWRGPVAPGTHTVTITHPSSGRTQSQRLQVTDGQTTRFGFVLGAPP